MTGPATTLTSEGSDTAIEPEGSDAAIEPEGAITIDSHIFGPVEIPESETLFFPDGILGFPECRRYVLLDAGLLGVYWLLSLDHGALVFLLIDPFLFVEGYSVDIGDTELVSLAPADASELAVLAIVTLPAERGGYATANLQGPIAFNPQRRIGRQVIVSDSAYGVRCPVELPPVA